MTLTMNPPLAAPDPGMPRFQRAFLVWVGSRDEDAWIERDGFHLFVRRGRRTIPDEHGDLHREETLELASFHADRPGQGRLTRLLPWLESQARGRVTYVENVMSTSPEMAARLASWFERHGYALLSTARANKPPCYFKRIP